MASLKYKFVAPPFYSCRGKTRGTFRAIPTYRLGAIMITFFISLASISIYQILTFIVDEIRRSHLLPTTIYIDQMGHMWWVTTVDTNMDIFCYSSYLDYKIHLETGKTCPFVTCGIKKFSTSGWKLYT